MKTYYMVGKYEHNGIWVLIDNIDPETGRGMFGGKTIEEIQAEPQYSIVRFMTGKEWTATNNEQWKTPAKETTKDRFFEMLGCLPPVGWVNYGDTESFKVSERISGDITGIYCRIGDQYFEMQNKITMPHVDILAQCLPLMAKPKEKTALESVIERNRARQAAHRAAYNRYIDAIKRSG